jgi:hypothetical protein
MNTTLALRATLPLLATTLLFISALQAEEQVIPNRFISYPAFRAASKEAEQHRRTRRVTEAQFIQMAQEEGTMILDSRSKAKYDLLHIKDAKHLNFSDFTADSLAKLIPSKDTRILIYCNNNFENSQRAFPTKSASTALNIPTFINLYSYGYRNIYELGPVVNPATSALTLAGKLKESPAIKETAGHLSNRTIGNKNF